MCKMVVGTYSQRLNACSFQLPFLPLNEVMLKSVDQTPKVHALDGS